MIITFDPNPVGASTPDYTGSYINFLRCVTAALTAPAGTTTLTVNPYTASNTIDTTKNCIKSIDYNTEAGGWIISASHTVPSNGNNTPTTYTSLNSATVHQYKADFYNNSGKSAAPYNKISFHTYNDYTGYNVWAAGQETSMYRTNIGTPYAGNGTNMIITFGCSTTTDWTDTAYRPGGASNNTAYNGSGQTSSFTLNGGYGNSTSIYKPSGLNYNDTNVYYQIAVTENYCIIWERSKSATDGYTNGYFQTATTSPNSGPYWNYSPRFGSVFYMGFRETQPWEDAQNNNPPWVCWSNHLERNSNSGTTTPYPNDQVAAYMLTLNNSAQVSTTPKRYSTQNVWNYNYMHGYGNASNATPYVADQGSNYTTVMRMIDTPLFLTRACGSSGVNSYANTNGQAGYTSPSSPAILGYPQYDPQTGTHVPGAYPIKISRAFGGTTTGLASPDLAEWNPGGACKGIYKSLSMPYPTMKLYWQSEKQTFTINGETYMPFVLLEDMWLVRAA